MASQPEKGIYRTIYYLPAITPAVASAVVWVQILNQQFGILNTLLGVFGFAPVKRRAHRGGGKKWQVRIGAGHEC